MPISPALSASLSAIGKLMTAANEPWWVISSAAVALHGADAGQVADVDVLLGAADARRILPAIGIEPRPGPPHPAFRSGIFGIWTEAALPIEFMADFQHRSSGSWLTVRPSTRRPAQIGQTMVFIPEKAELEAMLVAFGRPKDLQRARSLAGPS